MSSTEANPFFDHPILNSPYEMPKRHWELDKEGQPTQRILEVRRRAEFITPIPKPKKSRKKSTGSQDLLVFDEGKGLSTQKQQYDPTSVVNQVRSHVDTWRGLPQANGRSRRRRRGFSSIGDITNSASSDRFSARWRRWKL